MQIKTIDKTQLKCTLCQNYLSVAPIFYAPGIGNICGRCDKERSPNASRQIIYEFLDQSIRFPCQYEKFGCNHQLPYVQIKQHETKCIYQSSCCPARILGKCQFQNKDSSKLLEHIRKHHQDLFVTPRSSSAWLELPKDTYWLGFMEVKEVIFFVVLLNRSRSYYCDVFGQLSEVDKKCYGFELKILNEQKPEKCVILRKETVSIWQGFVDESQMVVYEPSKLKCILGTRALSPKIKLSIAGKSKKKLSTIFKTPLDANQTLSSSSMFQYHVQDTTVLICCICYHYIKVAICICTRGHSICQKCSLNTTKCPNCREFRGEGIPNETLQNFTKLFVYPCRNLDDGCPFKSKIEKTLSHFHICRYTVLQCYFPNCKWHGKRKDFLMHAMDHHLSEILRDDKPVNFNITVHENTYYLLVKVIHGKTEIFLIHIRPLATRFLLFCWHIPILKEELEVYSHDVLPEYRFMFCFEKHGHTFQYGDTCETDGHLSSLADNNSAEVLNEMTARNYIGYQEFRHNVEVKLRVRVTSKFISF